MEDVLELYAEPYDARYPVVCMDETSKQLVGETRIPLAAQPGRPRRVDYEYERRGTADVFMFTEPLRNWRRAEVSATRTRVDWAIQMKNLIDVVYRDAIKIRVVSDNLNTHSNASFYEAFPPEEARRLAAKLEMHHTPKHGSWLNIAEIELRALTGQCMNRRIETAEILRREVRAWQTQRNDSGARVQWHFKASDARIHLDRLYPRLLP